MKPLIAGNWKMHKTPSEGLAWLESFLEALDGVEHDHAEILLCVPFTHIHTMAQMADGSPVRIGSQDVSAHDQGAYTGEISPQMLLDAGARYAVVGHSERRQYHHEDDALVNAKAQSALTASLRPIVCVGESENERAAGRAEEVVLAQLRGALDGIELRAADDLVVAYEPVWAIGTGQTATADDAQAMGSTIRRALVAMHPDVGSRIRILYGGSMKPGNAAELLGKPDVDGGLIGGASLQVDDLLAIVQAAR